MAYHPIYSVDSNKVRLPAHEDRRLRQRTAINGFPINQINSSEDCQMALIGALPIELAEDMLAFIDHHEHGVPYQRDPELFEKLRQSGSPSGDDQTK